MLLGWRKAATAAGAETTRRVARTITVIVVALVFMAAGLALVTAGPRSTTRLHISGSSQIVHLPDYGPDGSVVVRYEHGRELTVRFQVTNRGLWPMTVEAIQPFPTTLGLLAAQRITINGSELPYRLAAGEQGDVVVRARFDHCEYFTEKAIDPYRGAQVRWTAGPLARTSQVAYPDMLLVRSPTMLDCSERVMDRSAKRRSEDATITGRG